MQNMKRTLATLLGIVLIAGFPSVEDVIGSTASAHSGNKAIKSAKRTQRTNFPPSPLHIAHILNWIPLPDAACNLCGGYFKTDPFILRTPSPLPVTQAPVRIRYAGEGIYRSKGHSILKKNVVITQPGRRVTADSAHLIRDPKTGQLISAKLSGNVHMMEYGKLLVAPQARVNFQNKTATLDQSVFHLAQTHRPQTTDEKNKAKSYLNAWGTAKRVIRTSEGVLEAYNASYTTCNPINPSWLVRAARLVLDKKNNVGKAYNATLRIHNVPVLWLPYYSFPLTIKRKTGFLTPTGGYSNQKGADVSLPFYWNMAPNYDLLITPRYMSLRDFQLAALFRFLTADSVGHFYGSYLFNDPEFGQFKTDTLQAFSTPTPVQRPYLDDLSNYSQHRGYVSFVDQTQFSDAWQGQFNFNYVSDPYYFHDVGNDYSQISANQLLNQALITYQGKHWNFTGLLQGYQTLHLINQISTRVQNQYTRLPELDLDGSYLDVFGGANLSLDMQAVEFLYQSDYYPITNQRPVGQRFHIRPGLSRPFNWASGYITPSIYVDSTTYNAEQATIPFNNQMPVLTPNNSTRPHFSGSRNLPIINLDSGLYFDRQFTFRQHAYKETLEPRLFYLYIPYLNQNPYPTFDTQLLPFSYQQLFSLNRFAGFDRLENANEISLGLTTRVFDADNAEEKLSASIGMAYYLTPPKVTLYSDETQNKRDFSPLVGQLTFNPTPYWHLTGSTAWDIDPNQLDNASITASYSQNWDHIALIGYEYAQAPGTTLGFSNNSNLFRAGFSWGLTKQWSALGYWYYNISRQRPESYFAGLQYDTCCVAVRFIYDRTFSGVTPGSQPGNVTNEYTNTYFIQLQLKGLGTLQRNDPSSILGVLPGYQDPLRRQPWS